MMLPVRRSVVQAVVYGAPRGVEISESKLTEMISSVNAAGQEVGTRRTAMRIPVEGYARIQPLGDHGGERVVGIYDMSRGGIAIVDTEARAAGEQFKVMFARQGKRPIEVMCTTRHVRRQGEGYIIGAEFGVSWLSAMSAAMV